MKNHIAGNAQCPKFKTTNRTCLNFTVIEKFKYSHHSICLKWRSDTIKQTDKSKDQRKYKHEDEDAWIKDNPGEKFKPFDPKRKIPYKPEERVIHEP